MMTSRGWIHAAVRGEVGTGSRSAGRPDDDEGAPSAAIGPDFTTMYVAWLTGRDTFHLAGYRIGAGGVQDSLFSRTMPGEMVSLAGVRVLVWNPGVSLYLVDPVTGKATRIWTAWTNAWGIFW
jgi:hypothetical protein